jgi:hypothetical protein
MARSLLQLPAGISFGESNDDIFLKPYFDLMKKLETIEKQYKQQTQKWGCRTKNSVAAPFSCKNTKARLRKVWFLR